MKFTLGTLFTHLLILALSSSSLGQIDSFNRQINRLQPNSSNQRRSSSTTERSLPFSTTTVSSLDGNNSDNVTDSKFILSLLKPSKETALNNTGSVGSSFISGDAIKNTLSTFLLQTNTCFGKVAGWSDPVLGNFTTTGDSPYCDSKCTRNFFCCAPFKPDQADVKFVFSTDLNDGTYVRPGDEQLRSMLQQSDKPVAFIIHGYLNNYQFDSYFNETKDGLIKKGYNVFVVDWARANRAYLQSIANVRVVGAVVGHIIQWLQIADRSTCIGFSLGAHICGEAGKWLHERQLTLSKCHGIDPAGPAYDGCGPELRLDPSDCGVVTAVHTSGYLSPSSLIKEGLGTTEKTGHCDFWINHGVYQPNCDNGTILGFKLDLLLGKFGKFAQKVEHGLLCSHTRAMYYLVNHVHGICNFVGKQARGCGDGKECEVLRSKRFAEFDEDSQTTPRTDPGLQNSGNRHNWNENGHNNDWGSSGSSHGNNWGSSSSGHGNNWGSSSSDHGNNWGNSGNSGHSGQGNGNNWGSSGSDHGNNWGNSGQSGQGGQGNDWNQGERWTNRPNQGSGNNEIGNSGSNRPNRWNQGHNSYSTTERPYGGGTSNYNRQTTTTFRPGSWNQGHHSSEKYSTRRPDLIASGSDNNDRWTSRPQRPFGGDGYTSSSTSSYDSDSDYTSRRPGNSGHGSGNNNNNHSNNNNNNNNNNKNNNRWTTTSRPFGGNGYSSTTNNYDSEYTSRRPGNGWKDNNERPTNGRPDFERPENGRPGRPGSSSNEFENNNGRPNERPNNGRPNRPDSSNGFESNNGRPDNDGRPNNGRPDFERPDNERPNRPGGNGFDESLNERPPFGPGSSNGFESNNGRPDFERPNNGRPSRPGGNGFDESPNERPPFGPTPRPDGWNEGSNNQRPPQGPFRPGGGGSGNGGGNSNGGNVPFMMGMPPDDSCTGDMNVDYFVYTSGYEPFC